ncbi:MAG: hypothetical protein ACP5VE_15500 [Chthonomonadales bacterium]
MARATVPENPADDQWREPAPPWPWWLFAIAVLAITSLPYLFGWFLQGARPELGRFSWLAFNLDDGCVYLSWLRQAADGAVFQRNLFTTEPQMARQVNLFFYFLGSIARITHLPPIALWHAARIGLGFAFLALVYRFLQRTLSDCRAQRPAYLLVCFSAGLGWMPGLWQNAGIQGPVDVWQPEAITFLSVYLNPLFIAAQILMVSTMLFLLRARDAWPAPRPVIGAGLCGFLLGNIHTYDVITLAAVWTTFLLVQAVRTRRMEASWWLPALFAGIPTAISTGYTAYLLFTERVFAQRAEVPTLSGPIGNIILGYGLVLVFAALGAGCLIAKGRGGACLPIAIPPDGAWLFGVWAVVGLAVPYAPVAFQRKLIMGEHLALAALAGVGLSVLLQRARGRAYGLLLAALVAATSVTNVRFLLRDAAAFAQNRAQSGIQRPYLYPGEAAALDWIRKNTPAGVPIQPLPWVALTPDGKVAVVDTTVAAFAPGLTGHPVNAGHWGETPDFPEAIGRWRQFLLPTTPDGARIQLLRSTGVRYILFTQKEPGTWAQGDDRILQWFRSHPPDYLRIIPEASNPDADVYAVEAP